jgi:hypothetical protein
MVSKRTTTQRGDTMSLDKRNLNQIIHNLESRIARLEKSSARPSEDIKHIKKAGVERRAGKTQLIYINQDQSDYFDLDYFADKGETFTVHTEALLKSNREYDREHKDYLTNNRGTLALERTNEAYNNGPGWWEVVYNM